MAEIRIVVQRAGQRSVEFEEWDQQAGVIPTTIQVWERESVEQGLHYDVLITSSQGSQQLRFTIAQWAALAALMSSVNLPHPRAA